MNIKEIQIIIYLVRTNDFAFNIFFYGTHLTTDQNSIILMNLKSHVSDARYTHNMLLLVVVKIV